MELNEVERDRLVALIVEHGRPIETAPFEPDAITTNGHDGHPGPDTAAATTEHVVVTDVEPDERTTV